jgi:hypothetical protein
MPAKAKSTNTIFEEYAGKRTKVTVRKLNRNLILIEGDRTAFEFLGQLFLAHARSKDRHLQFWPKGPGKSRFSRQSTLGFYLHVLPCLSKVPEGRS